MKLCRLLLFALAVLVSCVWGQEEPMRWTLAGVMLDDGSYRVANDPDNPESGLFLSRTLYLKTENSNTAIRLDSDWTSEPFSYEGQGTLYFYQGNYAEQSPVEPVAELQLASSGAKEGLLLFRPRTNDRNPEFDVTFIPMPVENREEGSLNIYNWYGRQLAIEFFEERFSLNFREGKRLYLSEEDSKSYTPIRVAAFLSEADKWTIIAHRFFRMRSDQSQILLVLSDSDRLERALFQLIRFREKPPGISDESLPN